MSFAHSNPFSNPFGDQDDNGASPPLASDNSPPLAKFRYPFQKDDADSDCSDQEISYKQGATDPNLTTTQHRVIPLSENKTRASYVCPPSTVKKTYSSRTLGLQFFASDVHKGAALLVVPAAAGVAVTGGLEMVSGVMTTTTLGSFVATVSHPLMPILLLTMGACRVLSGLADFTASVVCTEEELKINAFWGYKFPVTDRNRLRLHALYTELTAMPLIYHGALALQAHSLSGMFATGCIGIGTTAAMDCVAEIYRAWDANNPRERTKAMKLALCKFVEAAGWFMLMSNPVLGATLITASWLYKAAHVPQFVEGELLPDVNRFFHRKQSTLADSPLLISSPSYSDQTRILGRP